MTKGKDAAMRRIAIVLASLPEPVAQKLLGSLPRENQRVVRAALGSLSDVDPLEQRRALDGFAVSLRQDRPHHSQSTDAAEVVFSRAAIRTLHDRAAEHPAGESGQWKSSERDEPAAPLAFLLDVDDETLVAHLKGEMPQTLAIILASISPAQAARVLPRLEPAVRADAMRRIANLRELPVDLIEDIGSQLRDRFSAYGSRGTGRRALEAILAEMPSEAVHMQSQRTAGTPYDGSQRDGQDRAGSPGEAIARVSTPSVSTPRESSARESNTRESVMPNEINPQRGLRPEVRVGAEDDVTEKAMGTPRLKIAEGTWPQDEVRLSSAKQEGDSSSDAHSPLASTDSIHEYLVSLSTEELRTALGKADTRQALLTLCGLPNAKAESLLASLPRRQAKQVRDQLAALGTLHLREIDEAKTVVASLAYESAKATGAPSRAQGARGASADATSRPKTAAMSAAA